MKISEIIFRKADAGYPFGLHPAEACKSQLSKGAA